MKQPLYRYLDLIHVGRKAHAMCACRMEKLAGSLSIERKCRDTKFQ